MQYLHHLPKPQFLLQDEAFCENTPWLLTIVPLTIFAKRTS